MYTPVTLFFFLCLTATTYADHHEPCHSPNMTGFMSVVTMKGEIKAYGAFTYDSVGKKLRFTSNDSNFLNASLNFDLLMFFEEDVLYEIDTKNQTCQKKKLQCDMHPLDIPDDAHFFTTMHSGSRSVQGEGVKLNIWSGSLVNPKGSYFMSATMGCLPFSTFYITETASLLICTAEIETGIKDPDLLMVPSFCHGQPLEETPEGTVHSFFSEFM
ncbi:ependymin [Pholidichthys leucotaenia]